MGHEKGRFVWDFSLNLRLSAGMVLVFACPLLVYTAVLLYTLHIARRSQTRATSAPKANRRLLSIALPIWLIFLALACRIFQVGLYVNGFSFFWTLHWWALTFFLIAKIAMMYMFNDSMRTTADVHAHTSVSTNSDVAASNALAQLGHGQLRRTQRRWDLLFLVFILFMMIYSTVAVVITDKEMKEREFSAMDPWEESEAALFIVATLYFFGTALRFVKTTRALQRSLALSTGAVSSTQMDRLRSSIKRRVFLICLFACSFAIRSVQIFTEIVPSFEKSFYREKKVHGGARKAWGECALMLCIEMVPITMFYILLRKTLPNPGHAVQHFWMSLQRLCHRKEDGGSRLPQAGSGVELVGVGFPTSTVAVAKEPVGDSTVDIVNVEPRNEPESEDAI